MIPDLVRNVCVPQQTVMPWLGHADSAMVRHYYHLHDTEARLHMSRRLALSPDGIPANSLT